MKGKDLHLNYPVPNLNEYQEIEKKQIDVFIPHLDLAFEYQGNLQDQNTLTSGMQHYQSSFLFSSEQKERDVVKKEILKKAGITLIEIPYWWDMKEESLVAYIRQQRPDLLTEFISTNNPKSFISKKSIHHLHDTSLQSMIQLESPIPLDISQYLKNQS